MLGWKIGFHGLINDQIGNIRILFICFAHYKDTLSRGIINMVHNILQCHFFLTGERWQICASASVIHWELFLSNRITVSALTPDLYTAHNLPPVPEEASYSQGGNSLHGHTIAETYSSWQELHDSASPLLELHSTPTDEFMSKSILSWDGGVWHWTWYGHTRQKNNFLFM